MFVREKTVNGYTYLYLVESVRENGRTKQRIIRNLGRKQAVLASGALDRLIASIGRFAERSLVLRAIEEGDARFEVRRIGAPLLFGRLWEETGCRAAVSELVAGRGFCFEVERAVFVAVLHRLMVSGSDRSCAHWMTDYAIPGADGLALHRFYRAMAWLGEEVEAAGDGALAPRCVKDLIEEALFERRRDLFSELGLVFVDTTSLSFEGAGGEALGAHGYSKDHRPDLKQMVLAVVIDGEGRPVCTEMLAGNTSDSTVLLPVVDRLRSRFAIGRVCFVADRGMISAATIAALEERGLEYILGTRERSDVRVRQIVLENEKPFVPLRISQTVNSRVAGASLAILASVRRRLFAAMCQPSRMAPTVSAASRTMASDRWMYFSVVAGSRCPSSRPMVRTFAPCASAMLAWLCRRSWRRTSRRSASALTECQSRKTVTPDRQVSLCGEGKTQAESRGKPSRIARAADESQTVRGPTLLSRRNSLPSR